ncbi:hypothetical protein, partial [Rhizobium leucaenae]|uniref:hypothetical protein n=1 Tax=Rhizobium leucaenae TaxID=29450 RepID=UPI0016175E59
MTNVTAREMKVLKGLCLGTVEDEAYFPFVGKKTFSEMIAKGWIVRGCLKKRWVISTGYDSFGFARFDGEHDGLDQ